MKKLWTSEGRLALLLVLSIAWNTFGQISEANAQRQWVRGLFFEELRYCVPTLPGPTYVHCLRRIYVYRDFLHLGASDPNPIPPSETHAPFAVRGTR